jgi:hypothetical protein
MAVILGHPRSGIQMLLVLLAPLATGFVRKIKARMVRCQGPSVFQPYRDLLRLLRKEGQRLVAVPRHALRDLAATGRLRAGRPSPPACCSTGPPT